MWQGLKETLESEPDFRQYIPHGGVGRSLLFSLIVNGPVISVVKKRGRISEEVSSFVSYLSLNGRGPGRPEL